MGKNWRYLLYVLRHKRLVYREGRKLGLGRLRLLRHDLSKFSKAEWKPYAEWFYGYKGKGWVAAPDDLPRKLGSSVGEVWGYKEKDMHRRAFQEAWRHHLRRNAHHWEYWVDTYDEWTGALDEPRAREMPYADRVEMIADWRAMGYATKGYDDSKDFYLKTGSKMTLHPATRAWVEKQLGVGVTVHDYRSVAV